MARKNSIKDFIIGLVSIMVLLGIVGFLAVFTRGFEQDVATFYCRYNEQMLIGTADVIFPREKSTVEVKYLLEFAETNTDYTVKVTPNVEKDFNYKVGETSYKFSEIDDLTSCFKISQQEGYFTIDFSYLYTMQDVLDSKFYSGVTLDKDFDLNDYYFIMTVESNKKDTVIIRFGSACEHVPTETVGKAATCTESGLTNGSVCSVCGEILEKQEVILASHTVVEVAGKAATCTETGLTDGSACSVCGEVFDEQEIIPASHTVVKILGKAATCTETGLTDGSTCSVCGEVLAEQEEIAALGHDFSTESCYRCDLNYSIPSEIEITSELAMNENGGYDLLSGNIYTFNVNLSNEFNRVGEDFYNNISVESYANGSINAEITTVKTPTLTFGDSTTTKKQSVLEVNSFKNDLIEVTYENGVITLNVKKAIESYSKTEKDYGLGEYTLEITTKFKSYVETEEDCYFDIKVTEPETGLETSFRFWIKAV